jgi:hypothetical protein
MKFLFANFPTGEKTKRSVDYEAHTQAFFDDIIALELTLLSLAVHSGEGGSAR